MGLLYWEEPRMCVGVIGIGRMGSGVVARLNAAGHECVIFDTNSEAMHQLGDSTQVATSLDDLVAKLASPRVIWLSLPVGEPTDHTLTYLQHVLSPGDTVCDAGNSHFKQSQAHAAAFAARNISFLDVGLSGGVAGREAGYCLMVGGDAAAAKRCAPLFTALAQAEGYALVGGSGMGHFAKMVHNGVEYGIMQAYAEGAALLSTTTLDPAQVLALWQHGSIVQGRLGQLTAEVINQGNLDSIAPVVDDTGEGTWALQEAVARSVPTPVLAAAVHTRQQSQGRGSYLLRLLAALRAAFGNHPTHRS